MASENVYFVGVDVGTGSARAALVTDFGKIINSAVKEIRTWNERQDFYEQSSETIWNACVECIKKVTSGINPGSIKGLGFDATCSLAVFDRNGNPLSVSPSGNNEQNIILWLDHRAVQEANQINEYNHPILQYVGGKISPEMETPKLVWLKNNLKKECWDKAGYFFDLPDFLTWRATDCDSRSSCSLVCKWTYEMSIEGTEAWNNSYFKQIGLEDLAENNWKKIGSTVLAPGAKVGKGLSSKAAKELGLLIGTPVGTSMIDAHAGGLGLVGCQVSGVDPEFHTRLSLICGTSTCHMAVAKNCTFTPGIWGPYKNAMIPGMWLNEGGQSATGKLLDHVIDSHPASKDIKKKLNNMHIQQYLSQLLQNLAEQKNIPVALLTEDLHVYPDFHGNRSPYADPTLKGAITGLTLSQDEESLALVYLATVQALSYGTRLIIETLIKSGYKELKSTLICGGLSKNPLFTQTQADVCNLPVVCPDEIESVLLGAAILGACAANHFQTMTKAIQSMGGKGKVVQPNKNVVEYHNKKYKVYLKMHDDQLSYRNIMKE